MLELPAALDVGVDDARVITPSSISVGRSRGLDKTAGGTTTAAAAASGGGGGGCDDFSVWEEDFLEVVLAGGGMLVLLLVPPLPFPPPPLVPPLVGVEEILLLVVVEEEELEAEVVTDMKSHNEIMKRKSFIRVLFYLILFYFNCRIFVLYVCAEYSFKLHGKTNGVFVYC